MGMTAPPMFTASTVSGDSLNCRDAHSSPKGPGRLWTATPRPANSRHAEVDVAAQERQEQHREDVVAVDAHLLVGVAEDAQFDQGHGDDVKEGKPPHKQGPPAGRNVRRMDACQFRPCG